MNFRMKSLWPLFIAMNVPLSASAWVGGLASGLGESMSREADSMSRQSEMDASYKAQRESIILQHELEMKRIERDHELQNRRQQEMLRQQSEQAKRDDEAASKRSQLEGIAKVDRTYPGWRTIVKTNRFSDWMNKQPTGIKNLANSTNPDDAILLLMIYFRDQDVEDEKKLAAKPELSPKQTVKNRP